LNTPKIVKTKEGVYTLDEHEKEMNEMDLVFGMLLGCSYLLQTPSRALELATK